VNSTMRELPGRVVRGILKNNCSNYAAQMAFFFLFALFPFLLFLTTLLAYLPVPNLLQMLMRILGSFVPGEVLSLVEENLRALVSEQKGGLLSIGVLLLLWTASNAVTVVITALNDTFESKERRPYWKVRGISVLLVIGLSFFVIVSLLLLIFGPHIGAWIASLASLGNAFTLVWNILRWPLIFCLMVTALSALYRFAPVLRLSWHEIVPGAVAATGAWVAVSLAFSFYVNNFGSYNKTYGSIGAVIALLVWMYVSGFVILLGGEINARMKELAYEKAGRTITKGVHQMRKAIITAETRDDVSAEQEWLDLIRIARAELTSEDPSYPIESALNLIEGADWRASGPGRQTIRLLFDEPLRIRRIHLEFHEDEQQRTQEFVLRWSPDNGQSYLEIVRQQFNFAPPETSEEAENYIVDLVGVKSLELSIVPDISGGEARASLARLRLA
jgi:membrane protein